MKQGAHDFLPKPFTADELLTVVHRGLDERQRQLTQQKQRESEEEALQLRRTRQEIAKLEAIESRFMLVIVHELRNPAGVIKNYLQLMRAGYVDEDEWDEYLAKVDGRAGQLLRMLDDLLELAHLKGMLNLSKLQQVAAVELLEGVVEKLQPLAKAKGLALEREIQAHPTILAQPAHLESLWTNLIENAINYTHRGRVRVTLDEQNAQMVTVVSDTGIGISTEELTRIFQDFYRSEAAKAQVELGTGLGLPIVNQIVKIYQGTIGLDSTPGQGSSFNVSLPLAVSDVET
jgi:two-component system phosphate regulon sensor histidine kinase PhoR